MIYCLALSFVAFVFFTGCAARPLPPLTSADPASPSAAEAPEPPASATLTPAAGLSVRDSGSDHAGMAMGHGVHRVAMSNPPGATASYTCPMHPEVHAAKQGRCPMCGMTLVPQPEDHSATEGGHAH